ncbi:MAG TPA: NRDE family protein [Acidimicrobiales bacterium]|jgi:uncharacterized protein with NRDE domain
MCLLVMAFGLDPEAPLVVAANRDEWLDRPATSMTVLRESHPRILGGRDERAGGTWLAVNQYGLVAGLTNRPLPDGVDPTKRTRGELPLALASHRTAAEAVEDFVRRFSPSDYNPAWFLVGDRTSLYCIDLSNGPRPLALELGPGVHVLENIAFGEPSKKVDQVRQLLGPPDLLRGPDLLSKLSVVLADHSVPSDLGRSTELAASGSESPKGRRPETLAACVHTDDYGTRSSTLIRVPADTDAFPEVQYADGHPCTAPFIDAGPLWMT